MLWNLKRQIHEKFGPQWRFAVHVEEPETLVSHVVTQRRELPDSKKESWAAALECDVKEIFEE